LTAVTRDAIADTVFGRAKSTSAQLALLLGYLYKDGMERLFSTEDVHPRDRFDYWHQVACRTIVDHDSWPDCRPRFQAAIETGAMSDIGLVQFTNSPMTVSHTTRHVAQARIDDLFLCRQIAGSLTLEQEAREVVLKPGDMALLDPMLPYGGRFSSESNLLVVKLLRRELEARIGQVRHLLARAMNPLGAEPSMLSSLLGMLPVHSGKISYTAEQILKNHTLDLVALSLATMIQGRVPRISSARALVLIKVHAAIESRLTDPNLDAKAVAAATGVSVRYANAVLAEEDTSIARLIRERRLARCRKALKDPQQAHRSVSDIAYGWGFSDMTHFGRSFHKTYGMLPSRYRKLVN
jgi:AraC family transcriptional activator of tynA and feaB